MKIELIYNTFLSMGECERDREREEELVSIIILAVTETWKGIFKNKFMVLRIIMGFGEGYIVAGHLLK